MDFSGFRISAVRWLGGIGLGFRFLDERLEFGGEFFGFLLFDEFGFEGVGGLG